MLLSTAIQKKISIQFLSENGFGRTKKQVHICFSASLFFCAMVVGMVFMLDSLPFDLIFFFLKSLSLCLCRELTGGINCSLLKLYYLVCLSYAFHLVKFQLCFLMCQLVVTAL